MMSEKLLKGFNEQIKHEFDAANIYLAMAAYCKAEDLDGFANFFIVQGEEERFHAMKFFNFINEIGERAIISGFGDPNNSFDSVEAVFEAALEHEKKVTGQINELMHTALEDRNYAAVNFLNWFVNEQVEEEATFSNLIAKLKRIANNPSGIYMLDNELAQRVFTPPATEE
ncbi:ferritin [Alkaliphilus oremlandii]|uniref:Ferritin n=1 Tax=Alkaliphilus oremlandii (strain OhILAs) TaxID=350688 RepID=A8MIJ4_ALKOO|nr:ferritin [Alkaliphilus oremlandii]ABW19626.1 Ferritin Dps family protein [Alkaliphilus oremlandii OhILAs]